MSLSIIIQSQEELDESIKYFDQFQKLKILKICKRNDFEEEKEGILKEHVKDFFLKIPNNRPLKSFRFVIGADDIYEIIEIIAGFTGEKNWDVKKNSLWITLNDLSIFKF